MTGYPTPTAAFDGCPIRSTSTDTRQFLNSGVEVACKENAKCTYADATEVVGSTPSKASASRYFVDSVHLNDDGYCKLWTTDAAKRMFRCSNTRPCKGEAPSGDVPKSDSNVVLGSSNACPRGYSTPTSAAKCEEAARSLSPRHDTYNGAENDGAWYTSAVHARNENGWRYLNIFAVRNCSKELGWPTNYM